MILWKGQTQGQRTGQWLLEARPRGESDHRGTVLGELIELHPK